MTFWLGLLLGWVIGSIGTVFALMVFASAKRSDDWLYVDNVDFGAMEDLKAQHDAMRKRSDRGFVDASRLRVVADLPDVKNQE